MRSGECPGDLSGHAFVQLRNPGAGNPGLKPFDISDYGGVAGLNFFAVDPLLSRLLDRHLAGLPVDARKAVDAHLSKFGELVGDELNELTIAAHQEGRDGEIVHSTATGERINDIVYCHEQREVCRLCFEHGLVNLNYHPDWPHEFTNAHRMALAYLPLPRGCVWSHASHKWWNASFGDFLKPGEQGRIAIT